MAEPARTEPVFTLDIATGDHAPSAGRLFIAVVLRTVGVDEVIVEDAKLAVSEALTAATLAGHDTVRLAVDGSSGVVRIGPMAASDLDGDASDVISALFPGATTTGALEFTIPLDGSLP